MLSISKIPVCRFVDWSQGEDSRFLDQESNDWLDFRLAANLHTFSAHVSLTIPPKITISLRIDHFAVDFFLPLVDIPPGSWPPDLESVAGAIRVGKDE